MSCPMLSSPLLWQGSAHRPGPHSQRRREEPARALGGASPPHFVQRWERGPHRFGGFGL